MCSLKYLSLTARVEGRTSISKGPEDNSTIIHSARNSCPARTGNFGNPEFKINTSPINSIRYHYLYRLAERYNIVVRIKRAITVP
jgi:hypothetical protein